MPKFRPTSHSPPLDRAKRGNGIRDRLLLGLALFTLVHGGDALAGDQASTTINPAQDPDPVKLRPSPSPPPAAAALETAQLFRIPAATDNQVYSATEFRPRRHSVLDSDLANPFADVPMLRGTTVWQRMSDYKSHDRVRLVTLWESSGSTVSLQAGKHGDPSVQWTSRLMNRGGATQGLLDRLISSSLANAGNSLRNATRSTSAVAPKQTGTPAGADLK